MAALKLLLEDVHDFDFSIIAIHSSLEEYRIAFMINKYADLRLKSSQDVEFYLKKSKYTFGSMHYQDHRNYLNYTLIANKLKFKYTKNSINADLFTDSDHYKTINLIPEFKNADYLLKIESDTGKTFVSNLVSRINQIPQIITAYTIEVSTLKSKQNLIFE